MKKLFFIIIFIFLISNVSASIKESIIRDNNKKSLKPYFTFWRNYTSKEESSDSESDSESDDESLTMNEHIEKYFIEYIMAIGVALICWLKYKEKSYCQF